MQHLFGVTDFAPDSVRVFFSSYNASGLEQPHRVVSMPQDSYSSYHGISGLYINTGTVFE